MGNQDSNFRLVYTTDHSFSSPHVTAGKDNVPKVMGTNVKTPKQKMTTSQKSGVSGATPQEKRTQESQGITRLSQPCYFLAIHYLFDSFHQSVLIKSNGLSALMEVVLIAETELQHLLRIQFLQFGVRWGSLATQQPFKAEKKEKKTPNEMKKY